MKKIAWIVSALCFVLVGCNNGDQSRSVDTVQNCPANAPLFTTEIGIKTIEQWGKNANKNSPVGDAGYKKSNIGAAYFTLSNYAPEAVLLPTVSHISRVGLQGIYDYFIHFLQENPRMVERPLKGGTTLSGCGEGVMSGYYDFMLQNVSQKKPIKVHARYTMQFEYLSQQRKVSVTVIGGAESGKIVTYLQPVGWYIKLQNSAALPEEHEEFEQK